MRDFQKTLQQFDADEEERVTGEKIATYIEEIIDFNDEKPKRRSVVLFIS